MSEKTDSVVIDSSTPSLFSQSESDLDEDLDLTDTRLLSSDEEQLKQYIDIQHKTVNTSARNDDFIESFRFVPMNKVDSLIDSKAQVVQKDLPILFSDDDEFQTEKELSVSVAYTNDLPDYESPAEEETEDIKSTKLNTPDKIDFSYDGELLEMCSQNTDGSKERMDDDNDGHDDDDDDNDNVDGLSPSRHKVEKFNVARIAPYSAKNRNKFGKGKGKQPISGRCRYKSANKKITSPSASGTNKELIFSDSVRRVSFKDDTVEISSEVTEEDKPAAPMLCECCSMEEGHNSMVQCCDGHIVCTRCVEASAKKVLVGEKQGSVECPQPECSSSVPISELRKALPAIVLDLLEDKWNKATMEALENMKDVVKCPGCSFSAVLDISLKRFQCIQCNEAYCRYCEFKWTDRKSHDLCIRTKQWTSTVTGNVVNIPARWSDITEDSTDDKMESHMLVKLDSNSEEFLDVVHCMNKHMKATVRKIFRVQNERLWEKYSLTRSHMVADLGELNINERRLFHGTHIDVIQAICREGFDWRLCGKHGTVYGQGTYFAKSPVTSHRYSSGYSSSRRARKAFTGGLFFGVTARQPPPFIPAPRFGAPMTTSQSTGFTFGTPAASILSSGFTFGVPAATTTANNASAGYTFGGSASSPNPVYLFGSTLASTSSGSDTSIGLFGAAHAKHCTLRNTLGGSSSSIPPNEDFHNNKALAVSSSSKRQCSNCIFCSHKNKKPDTSDAVKNRFDPTALGIPTQKRGPTCSGSAAVSKPNLSSNGNTASLSALDQTAKILKQKIEMRTVESGKQHNTGAHLFVRSVPPTHPFGFSSAGNNGSGSHVHFGTGGSSSNAGGRNSGNGGNSSGNLSFLDVDPDNSSEGDCFMFLARVLVGRSCIGTSDMRRPEKNRAGQETHSAVDKEHEPTIFVIFDNNQCYPEYIIQYSLI